MSVSFDFETRIMSIIMSTSKSNYPDMSIWKKHADHSTTQDSTLVKSIFVTKRQNGKCNVRYFRRLFFGMSSDVPAFKVAFLQGILNWIK